MGCPGVRSTCELGSAVERAVVTCDVALLVALAIAKRWTGADD